MRHEIRHRPTPRGVTPRRLQAAERALQREQDEFPLFSAEVASEQPSAEERVSHADQEMLTQDQGHRDLAARHWKWARNLLREQPEDVQREILDYWNGTIIPPRASYFADFVRHQLRLRGTKVPPP